MAEEQVEGWVKLELGEDIYNRLTHTAARQGLTPLEWLIGKLDEYETAREKMSKPDHKHGDEIDNG